MVAGDAMSEFKFACPVCGQHITADSSTTGGQIDCPTCFQKIVVPQAPGSQETKFILSASQVGKPRPTPAEVIARPPRISSSRSSLLTVIALVVFLGAAGAALFVFRDRVSKLLRPPPPAGSNAPPAPSSVPAAFNSKYAVPTNFTWTLDLGNVVIPETTAAGSVHGNGFRCEKAILRGGLLSLNQGKSWPWDLGVAVGFFARAGEELSGKAVEIEPSRPRAPRVVLRWKDERREPVTESITHGYAMKVAFGQATNGHVPGTIYLCLPDGARSFVAGTFDAEIRKPPPPKRPPAKPPAPKG